MSEAHSPKIQEDEGGAYMKFIPRFDVRLVRDGRIATLESTIIRHPEDTLPIL